MKICGLCEEQAKKTRNGKPHAFLEKIDSVRIFKGTNARCYDEQDYQCQACASRFTHSTDKNNLAWTLWAG